MIKISLSNVYPISIDIENRLRRERVFFFWQRWQIKASVERYVKFLLLIQKYPNQIFVPTVDIDKCWHIHLESPVAYYNDCMSLFGKILDHNAGFGRAKEEKAEWKATFQKTALLWTKEYGEPYDVRFWGKAKVCSSCSNCRSRLIEA